MGGRKIGDSEQVEGGTGVRKVDGRVMEAIEEA
jgi:hypothetical protein